MLKSSKGFTINELLLTIGIFTILSGIIVTTMIKPQTSASVKASTNVLIADLRSQQLKSMSGDAEGQATAQTFGIHFETTTYTIFRGTNYSAGNSSNFVVNLDTNVQVSTTLPSSQAVFARRSGEITGFVDGTNTITLTNTQSGEQKVITLNKYGVPTIQ